VERILSVEPPISRVVNGLIAPRVPERSDRRGVRSGRLGRARHVERAPRVRAGRRDRPLARTTTRTPAWRPWSSRESRGSRGVGVHRSCREGPDWPVLSRPSGMRPCPYRRFECPAVRRVAPALLGQQAFLRSPSLSCLASPFCPSRAWGRARRRRENDLTLRLQQLECKHIAYDIEYMSHLAGCCTLIRTHWVQRVPGLGSSGERHDR
jgi:hypothetical protein